MGDPQRALALLCTISEVAGIAVPDRFVKGKQKLAPDNAEQEKPQYDKEERFSREPMMTPAGAALSSERKIRH